MTAACHVNVRSIPHVVIYDADANIAATDDGASKTGLETLTSWINDEYRNASKAER